MAATQDEVIREQLLHGNDTWDKGGWFRVRPAADQEDEGTESECETPQPKILQQSLPIR